METGSLEKCTRRVAPIPATLRAVVSSPDTTLRKGEEPFRSVTSGGDTTARRVAILAPNDTHRFASLLSSNCHFSWVLKGWFLFCISFLLSLLL